MPAPLHQRRIAPIVALVFVLAAARIGFCQDASSANATTQSAPIAFGTLMTVDKHAAEEYAGGVRLAMVELSWAKYEPGKGAFDADYAAHQRQIIEHFKAIGFQVTLALGAHYPPEWLKREANATFVDEKGRQSKDLNYVFNSKMRGYLKQYLERINADFGLANFWAIRITSGGNAELLYPGGGGYWAFDANAQNGPDFPADLPRCPFPGWKPGGKELDPAQVRQWADWYVRCLALTADWQMQTMDQLGFTGWYQILSPGSGVRPSAYESAVANRLPDGLLGRGAAWQKIYEFLPHKQRAIVYISSVADLSGNDDETRPDDVDVPLSDSTINKWSATRWQVRIAREYHMPVGGENLGYNYPSRLDSHYRDMSPSGMLARSFAQIKAAHFQCFYWAHSDRLWDGTMPFSDYASAMAAADNNNFPSPVWPIK